jgi:hypothetical protein
MKFLAKLSPLQIFLLTFACTAIPLFLFPINLFPGIIEINQGKNALEAPLSLSYFIGMGYDTRYQTSTLRPKDIFWPSFLFLVYRDYWLMLRLSIEKSNYNCPLE